MDYQGDIIRPPSEAFSILLQVTTGCSHNRCTFCGAYRDRPYAVKDWQQIEADLQFAATWCRRQTTVFLADGDALAIPHEQMLALLTRIRKLLPWVRRVSTYATCQNIEARTDSQLHTCRQLGLSRVYMGLESGDDMTLQAIGKGVDSAAMIEAGQRLRRAGMFVSVTCLLGIGGMARSSEHALATARVLSRMQPHQIAVLTLMLLPDTPLQRLARKGLFDLPGQEQLFAELASLLANLEPFKTQFHANHASNYFVLQGRLPKDRDGLLATIEQAVRGRLALKAEHCRGL